MHGKTWNPNLETRMGCGILYSDPGYIVYKIYGKRRCHYFYCVTFAAAPTSNITSTTTATSAPVLSLGGIIGKYYVGVHGVVQICFQQTWCTMHFFVYRIVHYVMYSPIN